MYLSVANCFITYSRYRSITSNAQVLLVAFAAIATLTENASSEISNHIEDVPAVAAKDHRNLDSQQKQLEKVTATTSKANVTESEKFRRSRYLRTMSVSPSMAVAVAYRSKQRSSAAAAAAAAAAADDDLRHFGRILKYHAVPYDARKPWSLTASRSPSRQPYGVLNTRYRYLRGDVRVPTAAAAAAAAANANNKWSSHLSNEAFSPHRGAGGDYAMFASDEFAPHEDYYEDGQSTAAVGDDGDYKKHDDNNEEEEEMGAGAAIDWYSNSNEYRDILDRERDTTGVAYDDAEPALSLQHAAVVVGKRAPFANHDLDPSAAAGGGRVNRFQFTPGRGEAVYSELNDWLDGVGGKRAAAAAASSLSNQYHRPQLRPASSLSPHNAHKSHPKYSPFEHDQSHRFKLDGWHRYPWKSIGKNDKQQREGERQSVSKSRTHRRRNKQRDRDRYSPPSKPSSSLLATTLDEDELASDNRYESDADIVNDRENVILTPIRRPPQPVQEDVVYSSRYRKKQAAAAAAAIAAAHHVMDISDDVGGGGGGGGGGGTGVDLIDPSRLFVNYHDQPAALSTKKRKFVMSDDSRKSSTDAGAAPLSAFFETDNVAINESYSPRKFNYKFAKLTTPSSVFYTPSSSSLSSSYNRKSSHRRPSTTTASPTSTTTTVATAALSSSTMEEMDDNRHSQTRNFYSGTDTDFDSDSNAGPNLNINSYSGGNDAGIKSDTSDPDRISASELIAYMSANPSEPVVSKQDRFTRPLDADANAAMLGYPFVRTFSERREKVKSKFYNAALPSVVDDQDFEINLDQYSYRRRR